MGGCCENQEAQQGGSVVLLQCHHHEDNRIPSHGHHVLQGGCGRHHESHPEGDSSDVWGAKEAPPQVIVWSLGGTRIGGQGPLLVATNISSPSHPPPQQP